MSAVGLLLVDKPEGPTSHDVIGQVRRALDVRRVGHTGTLDPFASGLLVLCIGWATRLAEYLVGRPKAYRAVARLGERTDTDDRTGSVIDSSTGWRAVSEDDVRRALGTQVGEIEQTPPAYSAKKVDGRRAYAMARGGESPKLQPQSVTISRLELCEFAAPDATFDIECSSGTYVRAVARDLGTALGVGGHLAALRRTAVGEFSVDRALRVGADTSGPEIESRLLPASAAVQHLPRADLCRADCEAMCHGRAVEWTSEAAGPVAVFGGQELIAIAENRQGRLWPRKVFGAAA